MISTIGTIGIGKAVFQSSVALAASAVETVVAAGSNTNGIIVYRAWMCASSAGLIIISLGYNSNHCFGIFGNSQNVLDQMNLPFYVPPGQPLEFRNSGAGNESIARRYCEYTIL